ncbi:MAG TPA: hypothetical protein PKZ32_00515 [Candidatus Melainabacteria bacterium]|nr:hypothetical protein [Candidatus Melainabacteria bacterium]
MALLDNSQGTTRELVLKDGVLRTDGAVASITAPRDWTASMWSKSVHPQMPRQISITLSKPDSKVAVGIFFSGEVLEEYEARQRQQNLFDHDVSMRASSSQAKQPMAESGIRSKTSKLQDLIFLAAPHPVPSSEKYCLGLQSTEFNGMKSVMFEFENADLGSKTIEYCIDVNGDGRVIYILYFTAPKDSFPEHMDTAVEIFKSTVWRKDFDPLKTIEIVD